MTGRRVTDLYVETVAGSHGDPERIELREELTDSSFRSAPRYRLPDRSTWFRKLLRPLSVGRFESEHWGKTCWHGRSRSPRRFARIFSLERLGEMIAQQAIPVSQLQLVDAAKVLLSSAQVAKLSAEEIIRHLFRDSGSLVVNQVERLVAPIADAVYELEAATGMYGQVNMYFTSAGAQTAKWHWDAHDVFLLQIHGEKAWKLYECEIDMPLLSSHCESDWPLRSEERARVTSEITMRPGDVLYIPGGVPHTACASPDQHSLHLTVGLNGVSWHDLVAATIERALLECEQDLAFRRLATVERGPAAARQRARYVRKLLDEVVRRADLRVGEELLLRKAPEASVHTAEATTRLWATMSKMSPIRANTVMDRTRMSFAVTRTAALAHIEVNGRKLSFDPRFTMALRWVSSTTTFPVESLPGALSPEEKIELCATLVDRGLLVPRRGRGQR